VLTGAVLAVTDEQPPEYRSPFGSWYERSTVRAARRRELDERTEDQVFFSADLVPVARHDIVRALPPEVFRQVLVRHLYRYLEFTSKLEHLVVNRTLLGIAHGTIGVELPDDMRFDAFKIYCDEAYHALFCVDLARQVRDRTGIRPLLPDRPYFLERLAQIAQPLAPELRPLMELMFVVVSETLISATLAQAPRNDETVVPAVREIIADHALDEGRHHAYFGAFLRHLWPQLDRAARRTAGRLVPALIQAFLRPEVTSVREELLGYGVGRTDVDQVVDEVFMTSSVLAQVRATAAPVIRRFAELDVLDDRAAVEEFQAQGLLA
jgi:hypothetical protein